MLKQLTAHQIMLIQLEINEGVLLMKYINYFILLFLISVTAVKASDVLLENIPSAGLAKVAKTSPEYFLGLNESTDKRLNLFTSSWVRANKGSPVDNRAYLFALAINLYNSIPPDLQPELRELEPGEDVYEPNLRPIKMQLYDDMVRIDGGKPFADEVTLEMKKKGLERFKKRLFKRFKEGSPEANARLKADLEYAYLQQHIREQVALGNILIDTQDAPASISSDELDIYNPKYYAELQDYMKKVQPLIDALTPPWEAEEQIEAITKQQAPAVVTKPQIPTVKSVPVQPTKPVIPKTEPAPDITDNRPWYLALGVLILLVAVGVLVRKRRQ